MSNPFSWNLARDFKNVINNTDVIHLQFPWPTGEILTLLSRTDKPKVLTFHCDVFNNKLGKLFYHPIVDKILDKVDVIVPTSENLLNNTPVLSKYKNKAKVINLWLDECRFKNLNNPSDSIKLFVKEVGSYALFVGVLRWYKGLTFLIEAAKKVKGNIVIVGKGPLYKELERSIKAENLKNIYLLGYQSDEDVNYLMQNMNHLVLPSISPAEAFGQVLLEASYNGRPMISTELGTGTSYVNLNEETGIVVQPKDVNKLAASMNLLFEDSNLANNFGRNAKIRFEKYFTESEQGPKYVSIYNQLL